MFDSKYCSVCGAYIWTKLYGERSDQSCLSCGNKFYCRDKDSGEMLKNSAPTGNPLKALFLRVMLKKRLAREKGNKRQINKQGYKGLEEKLCVSLAVDLKKNLSDR